LTSYFITEPAPIHREFFSDLDKVSADSPCLPPDHVGRQDLAKHITPWREGGGV
jgi:hypothetical protein